MKNGYHLMRSIPENAAYTASFAVIAAMIGILVVFIVATASTAGVMGPMAYEALGSGFVTFLPLLVPAITAIGAAIAALIIALQERAKRQTVKECEDKINTLLASQAPDGDAEAPAEMEDNPAVPLLAATK